MPRRSSAPDTRLSYALSIAAERRAELAALRAKGQVGAGTEALCNGALRHAIRLSAEKAAAERGERAHPLSRRQMDRLMGVVTRRRFAP